MQEFFDVEPLLAEDVAKLAASYGLKKDLTCGFWHVAPYPSTEELQRFYTSDYFQRIRPVIPPTLEAAELDEARFLFTPRLEKLSKLLPAGAKILDVGCGGGAFLKLATEAGFKAEGLETSKVGIERTRSLGLKVTEGFFTSDKSCAAGPFDAIQLNFVLEHIAHPREVLAHARSLLSPGGFLIVAVPNDFNPYQLAAWKNGQAPWWIVPKEHLNYFSPQSLKKLLEEVGFKTESVTCGFPIDEFLLMGENYLEKPEVGPHCHNRRKLWAQNLKQAGMTDFLERMQSLWAHCGVGREILIYARA